MIQKKNDQKRKPPPNLSEYDLILVFVHCAIERVYTKFKSDVERSASAENLHNECTVLLTISIQIWI